MSTAALGIKPPASRSITSDESGRIIRTNVMAPGAESNNLAVSVGLCTLIRNSLQRGSGPGPSHGSGGGGGGGKIPSNALSKRSAEVTGINNPKVESFSGGTVPQSSRPSTSRRIRSKSPSFA